MKGRWKRVKRYFQLSVLLIITAVCFVSSFFLDRNGNSWLSNAFLSISCGSITGLIFYLLANMRNGQQAKMKQEYEILYHTYQEARDLYFDILYYTSENRLEIAEPDIDTYCRTVLNRAYDIFDCPLCEIDEDTFKELGLSVWDDEYPSTDDEEAMYGAIEDIETNVGIEQANVMLTSLMNKLKTLMNALRKPVCSRRAFLKSLDESAI